MAKNETLRIAVVSLGCPKALVDSEKMLAMLAEAGCVVGAPADEADVMLLDNIKYTTVIVALIPIMILYPFLQRYFTKGILLGSVKG